MKKLLSMIAIAIGLSLTAAAQPTPITYELACPAGYSPLSSFGKTFNSTTGKWRANICVAGDGSGRLVCQMSGCGGAVPGSPVGGIQGNHAGLFAGLPGSSLDFTNGLLSLAPTGTGVALNLFGDANYSNQVNIFNNGQTSPGIEISPYDSIGQTMRLHSQSGGSLIVRGGTLQMTGSSGSGYSFRFYALGGNQMAGLTLNPGQGGILPGVGLTIIADNVATDDLQQWMDYSDATVLAKVDHYGNLTVPSCTGCFSGTGVNAPSRVALSSPASLTANAQTIVLTESVTFPAASATYRADVRYGAWGTVGSNVCAAEVIDTTNSRPFALSAQNANGVGYIGLSGSEISSTTYAAAAVVTFTLQIECNANTTITVNSGIFTFSPAEATYLSVTPILSQ